VVARRLVLGVHSGHVVCAAADGRAAPQLLPLQEAPASAPAGSFPDARPADLRLRSVGGASVSLEGFALSSQHALVIELQVEIEETALSRPPGSTAPGGAGGVRTLTVAWGCLLPYDAARRQLASGHLQLPLQFGARRAPLSGAPLEGVLGPVAGGVGGGDAARATLELRVPPNWAKLLPELPDRDAREAEAAGRREAEMAAAAAGVRPPDGAQAEGAYRREHFEEAAAERLDAEAATAKLEAAAVMRQHKTKQEVLQAEVSGQRALRFWAGKGEPALKRESFRGWALATKLLRNKKSAGFLEFGMHTLRVSAAARLPKEVATLHLELHPLVTARPQRTASLLRSADPLRLDYSDKLEVLAGTPAADTLLRALQSPEEHKSNVYVSLHGAAADGGRRQRLAECEISLKRLLAEGRDVAQEVST